MPHRPTSAILGVALALATAVALLQAGSVLTERRVPADVGAEHNATSVRVFYDALNAALRSGDPTPLEALIAPTFVEHRSPSSPPLNREVFERDVVALHATYCDLTLSVET